MNIEAEEHELIEKFFNRELNQEELQDFNARLNSDSSFYEIFQEQKMLREIIVMDELLNLKEKIKSDLSGNNHKSNFNNKIFAISTVILLAGAVGYIYFNGSTKEEAETEWIKDISVIAPSSLTDAENDETNEEGKSILSEYKQQTGEEIKIYIMNGSSIVKEIKPEELMPDKKDEENSGKIMLNKSKIDSSEPNEKSIITKEKSEKVIASLKNIESNNEIIKTISDPCINIKISAGISTSPSCEDNPSGSISIIPSSIKGGSGPYKVSLNNSDPGTDFSYEGLKSGTYNINIFDKNNCNTFLTASVGIKSCEQMIEDAFSPQYGERWRFPFRGSQQAEIKIMAKNGQEVFSSLIHEGDEWDGKSSSGQELQGGLYQFIIKFNNGTISKGTISIIR
ncbi:MAG: hypothetical protein ACK40G_09155 [Cytophagaceae bacterium]